ncbi:aminotransferase class III-fold pyridoxal phosphate-dependent enzyme [Limnoglobus roseus]|uniref:Aspartate aminotransferase family protein n=1 Tax=Limnoglobus roseus TaxID=2598579 RepID=A0A5C1A9J1_9BACT|nr:aminotransferase class III-fold pyridoxal phosphate-dependent enzyme [Limnoglobus roseus]QEL15390.1 aspartate aminotransferase family protein [Limnoglobus roseus]
MTAIRHADEPAANANRETITRTEPRSLRTFTPTQAVIAESAGVFHWTPDGRRLYDFSSGVLVSNLGHNPTRWMQHFCRYMGWPPGGHVGEYSPAVPMTAYNAITPVEAEANRRLLKALHHCPGGAHLQSVLWAASGSEAIQKALWAAMARDKARPMVLATRFGFHGKKGLSHAVTGSETDAERDPRVRFISFPMAECQDVAMRDGPFDPTPYQKELDALWHQFGPKLGTLMTEPYLGGGGSYHPPKAYLQLLERFCREHDLVFILDEVQANFGRTGKLFAFETYGLTPDVVVLGKGLGNGVPVAAAVGRANVFSSLDYGEASDTWSANPLSAAAVLATLDEFEARDVIGGMAESSRLIEEGLLLLKRFLFVANVRGEKGGMVWGVEMRDHAGKTAAEWANALVLSCYHGDGTDGVHLLGPLSKKVIRVAPPLTITPEEAAHALALIDRAAGRLAGEPVPEQHA